MAAALNWANKPLPDAQRRLAFTYGALAADRYLQLHHPELRQTALRSLEAAQPQSPGPLPSDEVSATQWDGIVETCARFDPARGKFVLATGRLEDLPAAALGLLPWALILDFDPYTETNGLYDQAAANLENTRAIHHFGISPEPVNYARATAWMMANGWPSRTEQVPDFATWRRQYLPLIRQAGNALRSQCGSESVYVLILATDVLTGPVLERTIEAIDEVLGPQCTAVCVGQCAGTPASLLALQVDAGVPAVLAKLTAAYGRTIISEPCHIPAFVDGDEHGSRPIPTDLLRDVSEDIEVLHSDILQTAQATAPDDAFWRGSPPTWRDLHANADILRAIQPELTQAVRERLDKSRNETLELLHWPGAGGTTTALRTAWELRAAYPVAVLRRYSPQTAERLHRLFQLCQKTILLVAEEALLKAADREQLYAELEDRKARVLILYVRRVLQPGSRTRFLLQDPMTDAECKLFADEYSQRTDDQARRAQLRRIAAPDAPRTLHKYRSPFYFGLITYERDFLTIEDYVKAHLQHVQYGARKVLLYLALVTRYSQAWLPKHVLQSIVSLDPTQGPLHRLLGPEAVHLLIYQSDECRLMHPLIAEEALKHIISGAETNAWKHGLQNVAADFIRDIVRIDAARGDLTDRLFEAMFISRDWLSSTEKAAKFSELISDMPAESEQRQILTLLRDQCPKDAHYWNHLGRHYLYREPRNFQEAETCLLRAVDLNPQDPIHSHTLGLIRTVRASDAIDDLFRRDNARTPSRPRSLRRLRAWHR